jgi:hypothetical protein
MTDDGKARAARVRGGRKARATLLATICACLLAGCGYGIEALPGSRFASPGIKVDLRPFSNASSLADAGAAVAASLREEMRRSGFRGEFDYRGADYLIDGKIREIRSELATRAPDGFALEHKLVLVVDIRVVEVVRGRLLWREENISETVSYYAGPDFQYTDSNRRLAFEEASRRLARRLGQNLRVLL